MKNMLRLSVLMIVISTGISLESLTRSALSQTRRPFFAPTAPRVNPVGVDDFSVPNPNESESKARRHCLQDQDNNYEAEDYFRLVAAETPVGITVEGYPTVLAYVPQTSASHVAVTITRRRDGITLYSSTQRIRENALNPLQLPDHLDPLEVGEQYQWSASLLCESVVLPFNPSDSLVLIRQSPDLLPEELQDQLAVERAKSLGRMGIWYDMLSRLYFEAADRRSAKARDSLREYVAAMGISLPEGDRI